MNHFLTKLANMTGKTGLRVQKRSPEIFLATGIVCSVGAIVSACRATRKVDDILLDKEEKIDHIEELYESSEDGTLEKGTFTDEERKAEIRKVHLHTAGELAKIYWPAVTLEMISIGCIIGSYGVMKKRNIALMAAYKVVEESFNNYRERVREEYGEETDYMFRHGLRKEEVEVEETDEKGKTKKVKKTVFTKDGDREFSSYAKLFDESNPNWVGDAERHLYFIRAQEKSANDYLVMRGHLFLNEVYDMLGIDRTAAGAAVGWKLGNGKIDFGLYDGTNPRTNAFINGHEPNIWLDFNVDGVIFDYLPE